MDTMCSRNFCARLRRRFFSRRGIRLSLVTFLLVVCGTVENIDYSVAGQIQMRHYRTFLNIFVVFVCMLFFLAIKLISEAREKKEIVTGRTNGRLDGDGYVAMSSAPSLSKQTAQAAPYWLSPKESPTKTWVLTRLVYLVMAALDTVALYLSILSSSSVTTPFRALIQQGAIPVSMFVSWAVFERVPAQIHLFAAAMIILGIAASSWQIFADKKVADYTNVDGETSTGWAVIFFVSTVFMSLGGCMKEWAMMHPTHPQSMNDVNFYVALNQLILGLVLSPAGFLLQHAGDKAGSIDELPENFLNGFKCGVLGYGQIQGNDDDDDSLSNHTGPCNVAVLATFLYVVVICSYNMLMLWVIKNETVVLFFVASAITMPLVALISASHLYEQLGLVKVSFSPWQAAGFIMTILGMIVYRLIPETGSTEDEDEDETFDEDGVLSSPYSQGGRASDVPWPDTPKANSRDFDVDDEENDGNFIMNFDDDIDGLGGLGFSPGSGDDGRDSTGRGMSY